MQSIEVLRDLAVFDRERIEHAVNRHGELRAANNYDAMAEYYSEHAVLELLGNRRTFHFAGIHRGRNAVIDILKRMGMEVEFISAEITELLIDGDRAMMRSKVRVRHRGTGLVLSQEIWDLFRFENGLIAGQTKFFDLKSFDRLRGGES